MAFKAISSPLVQSPMKRLYSARPAVAATPSSEPLPREPPRLSKLANGLSVASLENHFPISRISVVVKAGSRYEKTDNLGISHCLRISAGLSTKNATIFGLTRNLQLLGANVRTTSTRELLIYTLECNRNNLAEAMKYFQQLTCEQVFKSWEVRDYVPRMHLEVANLKQNLPALCLQTLHSVAFRSGLANSLFSPKFMLGKHDSDMLKQFYKGTFSPDRTALVGIGVSHDTATDLANLLKLEGDGSISDIVTKTGSGELRIEKDSPYAHVAIATPCVGTKNPKEALAAAILQQALGTLPKVRHSSNPPTKLYEAASKATENPFAVSALNISYTDGGIFGFYVAGQAKDMTNLVKVLVDQVSSTKAGIGDKAFAIAKNKLKSEVQISLENGKHLADELGTQALQSEQLAGPAEIAALIDSVTIEDVNNIAKKVANGKPSMAAVGNLIKTPHLDEIR